jgi:alpha-1,3-glucosyltransferase
MIFSFRYNCVCLGLVVGAVWAIFAGRELLGAALFVLSIAFKQMSLYYSPAFFFYMLAVSWRAAAAAQPSFAGRASHL